MYYVFRTYKYKDQHIGSTIKFFSKTHAIEHLNMIGNNGQFKGFWKEKAREAQASPYTYLNKIRDATNGMFGY